MLEHSMPRYVRKGTQSVTTQHERPVFAYTSALKRSFHLIFKMCEKGVDIAVMLLEGPRTFKGVMNHP